jgi:hypothetical protein
MYKKEGNWKIVIGCIGTGYDNSRSSEKIYVLVLSIPYLEMSIKVSDGGGLDGLVLENLHVEDTIDWG